MPVRSFEAPGEADVELRTRAPPADVAEQPPHRRRRVIAPAVFRVQRPCQVVAEPAVLTAGLGLDVIAPEGSAAERRPASRAAEAVLRANRQCAAKCVQAEQRVRPGNQVQAGDGGRRDRIPADGVAERLVHADAVLIDRQAFGRPEQRRGGEAAEQHVGLKRAGLGIGDGDAGGALGKETCGIGRRQRRHRRRDDDLHVGRDFRLRYAQSMNGRDGDDFDVFGELRLLRIARRGGAGSCAATGAAMSDTIKKTRRITRRL